VASPPADHYGKAMSVPDEVMWIWFHGLTEMRAAELGQLKAEVASGALHPKEAKRLLARLVVAIFNGYDPAVVQAAEAARNELRVESEHPDHASDAPKLVAILAALEEKQSEIDRLYARWEELERLAADAGA